MDLTGYADGDTRCQSPGALLSQKRSITSLPLRSKSYYGYYKTYT